MKKILLRTLALLGAGTATFCVTACYGPIPQGYDEAVVEEEYADSVYEAPEGDEEIVLDEAGDAPAADIQAEE